MIFSDMMSGMIPESVSIGLQTGEADQGVYTTTIKGMFH